jgi:large subunit ribosomal protein L22
MEARCVAKYLRVTPRKLRLVADLVRGKNVNDAISTLKFTPKAGARPALKAIQSAVANIVDRDQSREVNPDELVVRTIFVDEGPTLKRFLPRAMGRATPIRKRMSHLTVLVSTPVVPAVPEESAATPAEEETPKVKKVRAQTKKPASRAKAGSVSKKTVKTKKKTD